MSEVIIPYSKARDQLPTFTAINCLNKKWPYNWIGHTATIYDDKLTGQKQIFESTTLNKSTGISGVQMSPFGSWLANYPGKVFARVPKFGDSSPEANAIRELLAAEFIKEHLGTSYPDLKSRTGWLKLIMAALDFNWRGKDLFTYKGNDKGEFCTELFIKILQYCGLFGSYVYAHEFKPDDIRGEKSDFEDRLVNMMYLPEIQLK